MKAISLCLSLVFTLTLAGAVAGLFFLHQFNAPGTRAAEQTVVIASGQGVGGIAETLQQQGLIDNTLLFRIMARLTARHTSLKAGEYAFAQTDSMAEMLGKIADGNTVRRQLTVREGLTSHQVVALLNAVPNMSGTINGAPPEGTLLPETYSYVSGMERSVLLRQMQAEMTRTVQTLWPQRAAGLPLETEEQAVTLASIIEKETGIPGERRRVAGVFVNRLKKGMPLQTDPTVIYAITGGKVQDEGQGPLGRRLLKKDLEFPSPYNTYLNAGLPPGPIANPGRASIEAALNPERHDYLYFVADGSGGHVFAATLAEHEANVRNWRKIRRETKK